MEDIIPPQNNSPMLSTAVKLFILTHQRCRVCDGASYRTVLLQSHLSVFLLFAVHSKQLNLLSKNLRVFIRWEQKQFRHLLLTDSFGAEDESLTFRNIRHTLDNSLLYECAFVLFAKTLNH